MQTNKNHSTKEITVVGAGLVGSLLATYLGRRGHKVTLLERRPDMRVETISAGRSINLAISVRGLHALKEVGMEAAVLNHAVPMQGRMMHSVTGELTFQRYGKDDSEAINSISRGELNKTLMTAAEATGNVKILFNQRVTDCDLQNRKIRIQDERTGATTELSPEILLGTDGSASVIRQEMQKQDSYECSESLLDYGYKELCIPAGTDGSFLMERNALHIWPRGNFMLIALPNFDGSYTVTLFLPLEGKTPGELSFATLDTKEKVQAFFESQFGDAVPLISSLTETFFTNPTGRMVTIKSNPWHWQDWALLVGDAAHAIVPFFGQGANCGFEDCSVLAQLMDEHPSDWTRYFAAYSKHRKPDADAIADMAVANFIEMRDKVGNPRFLLEKEVEKILQKKFPEEYISRYSLVSFSRAPYRVAQRLGFLQDKLLSELCAGLNSPQEADLEKAHQMIQTQLTPEWQNYERSGQHKWISV
jgi:kynurenine 3-monooxygenase